MTVQTDPHALAAQLGVALPDRAAPATSGPAAVEPVELADYPAVAAAVERNTGDRSADTMRVVGACQDAGFTLAQTRWTVDTRPDLAARLAGRNDDDVMTCWLKAIDSRQQRVTIQAHPATDGGSADVVRNGDRFVHPRDGLLTLDLARQVMKTVICGFNPVDGTHYVYQGGVWTPSNGRIETAVAGWLGNRYRNSHCRNVLDMIRYAPGARRIGCEPQPEWINVPNGMIRWKDGTLHAHSPDYGSTTQLAVEYDQDADCPRFFEYLRTTLPADCYQPTDDSPGFIWELIAYALYSGNPLHIAVLLYGTGRNGKGALLRVLKRIIGPANYSTATIHELAENRFRAATLFGKLANLAGDLDSRWLASTATFKAITGGDAIQGEHKYGAVFDFTPWAVPFYSTNRAFGSADSSEGWVARWVVVPFPNTFTDTKDPELDGKIGAAPELRGILRRAVAALPTLMARGRLPEPASVLEAKQRFVTTSDAVRSWISECCYFDADAWTPRTALYKAYRSHAEDDGTRPLSAREFYTRLEQVSQLAPSKRQGDRGFTGLRFRSSMIEIDEDGSDETVEDTLNQGAEGAGSLTPNAYHGKKGRKPAPSAPFCPQGDNGHTPDTARRADLNLCRDCQSQPHSPGRPRCEDCHRAYVRTSAGYDQ